MALRHGMLALLILTVAYWDRRGEGEAFSVVSFSSAFAGAVPCARASREAARGNALMSGLTRSAGPRAGFEGF